MKYNFIQRCNNCGAIVNEKNKFCPNCGEKNAVRREAPKDVCGNCGKRLGKDDKYCVYCGTKAGEGTYTPVQEVMQCIYGPMPVKRTHKCSSCGYEWETVLMLDKEKYCPKCGGDAPCVKEEY